MVLLIEYTLINIVNHMGCNLYNNTLELFDFVGASHPSQQFFSIVRMISCLPGLNQY